MCDGVSPAQFRSALLALMQFHIASEKQSNVVIVNATDTRAGKACASRPLPAKQVIQMDVQSAVCR